MKPPQSKSGYLALLAEVTNILHEHDPGMLGPDVPRHEYEPEAARIIAQSVSAVTPDQFAVVIANVLRAQFDEWTAGQSLRDTALALDIWSACKRGYEQ